MPFAVTQSRAGWTPWHLVGAMVMLVIGVAATYPAWVDILETTAERRQSQHLILLPVVIAWLVWVRRERFKLCPPGGTWVGPVLFVLGWVISTAGQRFEFEAAWHVGAVAVLIGCVVSVFGVAVLTRFAPAFGALLFAVPLPFGVEAAFTRPLGDTAIALSRVIFGYGDLGSREAASGVLCAVLLGYAFAFSMPFRGWVRVLLVLASPFPAVLALMLQVAAEPILDHRWSAPAPAAVAWTEALRWLLVPLTLAVLAAVIRLLRWAAIPLRYYKLADEA